MGAFTKHLHILGHNSDLLLKCKKSSETTIAVMERHLRTPAVGSIVKDTSNCHRSGSTTISRIKSYFSRIFSASDWVWQGCQCWPILMGYCTPLLGRSGLGTPYLSGRDFLRAVLQAETLPPQPSFLPLSFQTALQSEGFFCLLLLLPFYSLAFFLQQVSWKTDLILVRASQMTWTNTMTLKITLRNCFEDGEHGISISTEKRSGRN